MQRLKITKRRGKSSQVLALQIPTSWHEITVKQYLDIEALPDKNDVLAFVAVLAGCAPELLGQVTSQKIISKFQLIVASVMAEAIDWGKLIKDVPKTVLIKGKECKVKGFGKFTLAQRIVFEQLLKDVNPEEQDHLIKLIPDVLALAFMPQYFGEPFNKDKMGEMRAIIQGEKVLKMLPPAYFFLTILLYSTAIGGLSLTAQAGGTLIKKLLEKRPKHPAGGSLATSG